MRKWWKAGGSPRAMRWRCWASSRRCQPRSAAPRAIVKRHRHAVATDLPPSTSILPGRSPGVGAPASGLAHAAPRPRRRQARAGRNRPAPCRQPTRRGPGIAPARADIATRTRSPHARAARRPARSKNRQGSCPWQPWIRQARARRRPARGRSSPPRRPRRRHGRSCRAGHRPRHRPARSTGTGAAAAAGAAPPPGSWR